MKTVKHIKVAVFALVALALAALPFKDVSAQVVTQLPIAVSPANTIKDLGNGPLEIKLIQGAAFFFTSQGSGTGTSAGTTALTLSATPASNPPLVGGFITCNVATNCSIPASTTVTAYNGTTGVTTSVATTVTAAVVNWGAACPSAIGSVPAAAVQASSPGVSDWPFYTQSRLCAATLNGPGAMVLTFPIGAH